MVEWRVILSEGTAIPTEFSHWSEMNFHRVTIKNIEKARTYESVYKYEFRVDEKVFSGYTDELVELLKQELAWHKLTH